jgi:hypothetical protein
MNRTVKAKAARQTILNVLVIIKIENEDTYNSNQSNPSLEAILDELLSLEVLGDILVLRFSKVITLPKMSSPRFNFILSSLPRPLMKQVQLVLPEKTS